VRGVNPVGRQQPAAGVEIGGGKAELPSEFSAANDFAGEGISAPQHLAGRIEITGANGLANPGAADGLSVERDGGESVNLKLQFRAQPVEQGNVPAAPVAKHEIRANTDALNFAQGGHQAADEGLAGLLAEFAVNGISSKASAPRAAIARIFCAGE
jgi:hypothetical protein